MKYFFSNPIMIIMRLYFLYYHGKCFSLNRFQQDLESNCAAAWENVPLHIFYILINEKNISFVFNPCHAVWIKMPHPLLIFSQSEYLILVVDTNSHTYWQTVQIQISWSTDLDLHSLQRQGISAGVQQDQGKLCNLTKNDIIISFVKLFHLCL